MVLVFFSEPHNENFSLTTKNRILQTCLDEGDVRLEMRKPETRSDRLRQPSSTSLLSFGSLLGVACFLQRRATVPGCIGGAPGSSPTQRPVSRQRDAPERSVILPSSSSTSVFIETAHPSESLRRHQQESRAVLGSGGLGIIVLCLCNLETIFFQFTRRRSRAKAPPFSKADVAFESS